MTWATWAAVALALGLAAPPLAGALDLTSGPDRVDDVDTIDLPDAVLSEPSAGTGRAADSATTTHAGPTVGDQPGELADVHECHDIVIPLRTLGTNLVSAEWDIPNVLPNMSSAKTVRRVCCEFHATGASPAASVMLKRNDGSSADILSGPLSCVDLASGGADLAGDVDDAGCACSTCTVTLATGGQAGEEQLARGHRLELDAGTFTNVDDVRIVVGYCVDPVADGS